MNNIISKSGALAVVCCASLLSPVLILADNQVTLKSNPVLKTINHDAKPVRDFHGKKPWGDWSAQAALENAVNTRSAVKDPSIKLEDVETFDFLEGPDGTTWFYYAEYEKEYEQVSEWFTQEFIKSYKFTIFDSNFKEVGTIEDAVFLQPGETRVAHAVLDPTLSRFFFNDDDNVEVMVYIAMNTSSLFNYEVNYYNKVYSIGGAKNASGYDVCIGELPGRCVDTFNASTTGENFFMTFVEDVFPNPDDYSFDQYIDYINDAKSIVSVYNKNEAGVPDIAFEKEIYLTRYPGDTTDGIYLITKVVNNEPYFVFSFYEKPYFVDPTGMAADENATPDNNFVIEAYKYTNRSLNHLTTTKIPVDIVEMDGQLAYAFYSIGSVTWKNDIDVSVNGTPDAPAYIVAKDFVTAANLDDVASSYYMYDNGGNFLHALAELTDGINILYSEDGDQPHALFTYLIGNKYEFSFVDLYSGNKVFGLDQENGGDPLTAICQRIKGADGKYLYAFELEYDDIDDEGNDIKRIAWFGEDGKYIRTDNINMGPDVMYATINMYPECLNPRLFDDDDAMEYAVLVKRAFGNTTRNEFLVVDDNGARYAYFTEDEGKGLPMMFSIVKGKDADYLQMVYNDNYIYQIEVYALPFVGGAGIDSVTDDSGSLAAIVRIEGGTVYAEGCVIEIYNGAGMKMRGGRDSLSLSELAKGVYVIKVSDGKGGSSVLKRAI